MKNTTCLLLCLALCWMGCDQSTTQKASQSVATAASSAPSNSGYVSPTIYTEAKPIEALPADSIPVSYSVKGIAAAPLEFVPMMGEWVSAFDQEEEVHFQPGKYVSFYQGEKVVEEHMVYYRNCPNTCTNGTPTESACFVLASDYGQMCFSIVKHTAEELEIAMLGNTDPASVLSYTRKR